MLILISFGWFGWGIMTGMVQMPIMETFKKILTMSVILAIATNSGLYQEYISDWLWQSPELMANMISFSSGNGSGSTGVSFTALDKLFFDYYTAGKNFWDLGMASTIPNFGFIIIAVGVWFAGLLVSGYIAFLLIITKIGLAIFLATGQLFVMFAMFGVTRKYFEAWIGQVFNFLFVNLFAFAIGGFILQISSTYITGMSAGDILDAIPLFGFTLLTIKALYEVPAWSANLSGGTQLNAKAVQKWTENRLAGASNSAGAAARKSGASVRSLGAATGINNKLSTARNAVRDRARTINNFGRSDSNSIRKGD
jgi:type IV secretion system protein VirB6